ncbi:MAG: hypothetical protein P4L90_11515 [Rhodopila sp.]|nr:hypothetical protein [Rhodopila sp.]
MLVAIRWWVADFRQHDDPLPRLCQAMGTAGARDAAFSVDQLMSVFIRSARRPMAIHGPRCRGLSGDEKHLLNAASLVQAGESKMADAHCVPPCCQLKARNSRLVPCTGWVRCSPKPGCSSVAAGRLSQPGH